MAFTFGSPYTFNGTNQSTQINSCSIDSTHFITAFRDQTSAAGKVVIGTVASDGSISYGSTYTFLSGYASNYNSIKLIDSTHFVVTFANAGNSNHVSSVVGTIAGDLSVSFGSIADTGVVHGGALTSTLLSSTCVVVAVADSGNSYYGTIIVGTISGSTITFGTKQAFNSANTAATGTISLSTISSSSFCLIYSTGSSATPYARAQVCTVSGTVVTFNTEYNWSRSTSNTCSYISSYPINSTKILVAYRESTSTYLKYNILDISGTTISVALSAINIEATDGTWTSICKYNDNTYIISYRTSTNVKKYEVIYWNGTNLTTGESGTIQSSTSGVTVFNSLVCGNTLVSTYCESTGTLGSSISASANALPSYGTEATAYSSASYYDSGIRVLALDSSHFIEVYPTNTYRYGACKIGTIASDNTITYGSEYWFYNSGATYCIDAVVIDSTHVLITFSENIQRMGLVLATISGSTISYSTISTTGGSSSYPMKIAKFDSSHSVFMYNAGSYAYFYYIGNGGYFSTQNSSTYTADNINRNLNSINTLSSTLFSCSWIPSSNSYPKIAAVSNSGGTFTFGSATTIKSAACNSISSLTLDSTHTLVIYTASGIMYGMVVTHSDRTITLGTEYVLSRGVYGSPYLNITLLETNKALVIFPDSNNVPKTMKLTISDTTIVADLESNITSTAGSYCFDVSALSNSKFVVLYLNSSSNIKNKVGYWQAATLDKTYSPSGGCTLSGSSTNGYTINKNYSASGSVILSGAAETSYTANTGDFTYAATGSITLSGSASKSLNIDRTCNGGLLLSGSLIGYRSYNYNPSMPHNIQSSGSVVGLLMLSYSPANPHKIQSSGAATCTFASQPWNLVFGSGYVSSTTADIYSSSPIARLTDSSFVQSYFDHTSTRVVVRVGSVSNGVITYGNEYAIGSASTIASSYLTKIDDNKFLMSYRNDSNLYVVTVNISGTVISFGTPLLVSSNQQEYHTLTAVNTTTAQILYTSGELYSRQITISGDTCTMGSENDVGRRDNVDVAEKDYSTLNIGTLVCTINGNDSYGAIMTSYGGNVLINTPTLISNTTYNTISTKLSTKTYVVAYQKTSSGGIGVKIGTKSSNDISFGSEYVLGSGNLWLSDIEVFNAKEFVITYTNNTGSSNYFVIATLNDNGSISFNPISSPFYVGILSLIKLNTSTFVTQYTPDGIPTVKNTLVTPTTWKTYNLSGGSLVLSGHVLGLTTDTIAKYDGSGSITASGSSSSLFELTRTTDGSFTLSGSLSTTLAYNYLPVPSGSLTLSGSNIPTFILYYTSSGSVILNGLNGGIIDVERDVSGSGVLSGSLTGSLELTYQPLGSMLLSGSASCLTDRNLIASGYLVLSGSSSFCIGRIVSASGSITLSGHAVTEVPLHYYDGSGSIYLSGSASIYRDFVATSSGSLHTSGSSTVNLVIELAVNGSIKLDGSNACTVHVSYQPSGLVQLNGEADVSEDFLYQSSGSQMLSGSVNGVRFYNNLVTCGGSLYILPTVTPVDCTAWAWSAIGGITLSGEGAVVYDLNCNHKIIINSRVTRKVYIESFVQTKIFIKTKLIRKVRY